MNLRILYDLPFDTHCWVVEELSGGKHFKQMIYSRFLKYLSVLRKNKRSFIRTLYTIVQADVRTLTGSNIRRVLLDTNLDPRSSSKYLLSDWRAYEPADTWTVPLLASLLEMRQDNWEVLFDVEDETITLEDDEITFMVEALCRG